jgi:histidyl-tRNA synthetase
VYRAPRGTADILPEEQPYWHYVAEKAAALCRLYGYERIDSPAFEDTGLFTRSVGQGTDIVEKEMYTFEDKGGNRITLRPEGTAPVCRAYIEHGMYNLPQPVKLYYFADIFRYERPQAGRWRQHHQFGCEAIGSMEPSLDAEVIDMAWRFFTSLGLGRLTLQLNSIGCKQCRPHYIGVLKDYYAGHAEGLCPDCKDRLGRNTLRLLDCKNPSCQPLAEAAPKNADYLCPECAGHYGRLRQYLDLMGLPYNPDHRLVRGLDYYTRTVFEVQPEDAGGQSTLGGGGRYDDLIEELGGRPTPAIGFATGIERIVLNLKKQGVPVPALPRPRVYIAALGEEALQQAIGLAAGLRRGGTGTLVGGGRSLKAQMRQANSLGASHVLLIGEDELKAGTVTLRDMSGGSQRTVPAGEIEKAL